MNLPPVLASHDQLFVNAKRALLEFLGRWLPDWAVLGVSMLVTIGAIAAIAASPIVRPAEVAARRSPVY